MRKALIALVLGICLLATTALAVMPSPFTSGWGDCNTAGNYGGWDQVSTCKVSWDGACTEETRDATFTVGQTGRVLDKIIIEHLDGVAETTDSFEVKNGNDVLCSFADVTSGSETWKTLTCDVTAKNLVGETVLTFHPTANGPWAGCGTWGQVAVKSISYQDHLQGSNIPEFSAIGAGLALAGAGAGFLMLRRRK
jgi:hypothetical protein